jgi:GAF domain-containing protein
MPVRSTAQHFCMALGNGLGRRLHCSSHAAVACPACGQFPLAKSKKGVSSGSRSTRAKPDPSRLQHLCGNNSGMTGFVELAARVSEQLDSNTITLRAALVTLSRHLQRQFHVSRVTVWGVEGRSGNRTMRRAGGFDGVAESAISENAVFADQQVAAYLDTLLQSGVYSSPDTFADPLLVALKESYLEPLDIRASLDGAISINGELIAVFCFAQQGSTRQWTLQELTEALGFARNVALLRARRLGRAGKSLSLMQELDEP